MTSEERIEALEKTILGMQSAFDDYASIHQQLAGQARIYEAAVSALVAAHPQPELLRPVLVHELALVDASSVAISNSEERVVGVQSAQRVVMKALAACEARQAQAAQVPRPMGE